MGDLTVSVVIARSRDSYKETVESLKHQECEILVVDGVSGLSTARNEGMAKAKNDLICFLDDDVVVHPNYIKDVQSEFLSTGADIVGGLVMPLGELPFWFPTDLHFTLAINPVSREIYGCNFVVKKRVFSDLNFVFNQKLGRGRGNLLVGDESELFFLAKEKGLKIYRSNKAVVYHRVTPERKTYGYLVKRVVWEGRSEIRRGMFARHLFFGLANTGLSFLRWLIYATSYVYYIYGAGLEIIKGKKYTN
jgi:glycosyltransferase involved in cell wall biosynthesis